MRFDKRIDVHQDHAGLYGQGKGFFIKFKNTVHLGKVQHDAAVNSDGGADQPGSLSARSDRNMMFVGVFHDRGDLVHVLAFDHDFRPGEYAVHFIMAEVCAERLSRCYFVRTDDGAESLEVGCVYFFVIHFELLSARRFIRAGIT